MANQLRFYIASMLSLLLICSCSLFDDEDPLWPNEHLGDFVIYAFGPGFDFIASIDAGSGEISHPFPDFKAIQSVVANELGTRVFVSTGESGPGLNSGFIYKIDAYTGEYEKIYDHAAHLLTDRQGSIYFITKETDPATGGVSTKRIFGRIDSFIGTVTELDSIDVVWRDHRDDSLIEIHPDKPLIYAVDRDKRLYEFDYERRETRYLFPEVNFQQAARLTLSCGGDTLYIPGGPVLDLAREEIVGRIPVWRLGSVAARCDNREVYITDPGQFWREVPWERTFSIYSPAENQIIDEIGIGGDRIYLTTKERYAVVNDWIRSFAIIDLKYRRIVDVHEYDPKDRPYVCAAQSFYLARKPPGLKIQNNNKDN